VTDPDRTNSDGETVVDSSQEYGYARPPKLQEAFIEAAEILRSKDGWSASGPKQLVADLALEGGGVKGIAIVGAVSVLAEAGYSFPRVAGTSAGAIAATLIAAISKAGKPMSSLKGYLDGLSFKKFMPEGKIHEFFDHHLGKAGGALSDADILMHRMGLYPGDYLAEWLDPILHEDLGVRTFADLKITLEDDPGMSLPEDRRYRLVVHTSDVTRGQLVHLPWDYGYYGHDRDTQDVVSAVRASMSIPFFFEPVTFDALEANGFRPHRRRPAALAHHRHKAFVPTDVIWGHGGGQEHLQTGASLPQHHDERVGCVQPRRGHGGPDHICGQRRAHGHRLRSDRGATERTVPQRRRRRHVIRDCHGCTGSGAAHSPGSPRLEDAVDALTWSGWWFGSLRRPSRLLPAQRRLTTAEICDHDARLGNSALHEQSA
jgi:predicted acylesterase/phospholipase RssA